jgi:hypothetical protein
VAGRHLPADPSKGDANTIGGYRAVHDRPAAFEGSDGYSYSVELNVDSTGSSDKPFGAYLFFLRWKRMGEQGVAGHLESGFLTYADREQRALDQLGAWSLSDVRAELERLIAAQPPEPGAPRRKLDIRPADEGAA